MSTEYDSHISAEVSSWQEEIGIKRCEGEKMVENMLTAVTVENFEVSKFTGEFLLKLFISIGDEYNIDFGNSKEIYSLANFVIDFEDSESVSSFKNYMNSTLDLYRVKQKLLEYGIEFRFIETSDPDFVSIRVCFDKGNISLFEKNVNTFLADLCGSEKNYLLYKYMIKTVENMEFQEKLTYYKNEMRKEIERKKHNK